MHPYSWGCAQEAPIRLIRAMVEGDGALEREARRRLIVLWPRHLHVTALAALTSVLSRALLVSRHQA